MSLLVRRCLSVLGVLSLFVSVAWTPDAIAQSDLLNRRDGFLTIWHAINRPAYETHETPYVDVSQEDEGFLEITYAKRRGLLSDEIEAFRPKDPLTVEDAVMWLYRTRNVADVDDMQRQDLAVLHERYPIFTLEADLAQPLGTMEDLIGLMQHFDQMLRDEVHEVSLYSEKFHGKGTAFGETFDMHAMTAAHRTYPHNTLVRVTNVENGESVLVRINDRGPFVHGRDMDLSLGAFTTIAERSQGVIDARFERLGDVHLVQPPELREAEPEEQTVDEQVPEVEVQTEEEFQEKFEEHTDTCPYEDYRYQKRITRDVRFARGVPHTLYQGNQLVLQSNKYFVVRDVRYPDGNSDSADRWIGPDEKYQIIPSLIGEYVFLMGTANGRQREMRMNVIECEQ